MFQFYRRRETSVVCSMQCYRSTFESFKKEGCKRFSRSQLPVHLEKNDFVLMFEVNKSRKPTGNELTLFVPLVCDDLFEDGDVLLEVVTGDPDAFVRSQSFKEV